VDSFSVAYNNTSKSGGSSGFGPVSLSTGTYFAYLSTSYLSATNASLSLASKAAPSGVGVPGPIAGGGLPAMLVLGLGAAMAYRRREAWNI